MQIDFITGAFFFFLAMGIFYYALSAYWFVEDLINKCQGKSKTKKTEYTEEEEFYATLLQMKSDLDADAFRTRKAMLDEVLKHRRKEFLQRWSSDVSLTCLTTVSVIRIAFDFKASKFAFLLSFLYKSERF